MNFNRIKDKIEGSNISLTPISSNDRKFIDSMFEDPEIKRYYIVPKEARQDYKNLIDYWLNDIRNEAGTCWIISAKGGGLFSTRANAGFIAFEFRDTIKNARISYAILPNHRRKGIASKALELVIDRLKENGIEKVEADIDQDNVSSEKVVQKHGFTANKSTALIDPEMMRDGEIRLRALWKKEIADTDNKAMSGRIPLDTDLKKIIPLINEISEEINSKGQLPNLMLRYFYLLGRIKFLEGKLDEAKQAFGQCNMITMSDGLPELHESYYWFAKIMEAKGESGANMYYGFALENYNENPDYITKEEIEREMNK